jgi:hypothetical protein
MTQTKGSSTKHTAAKSGSKNSCKKATHVPQQNKRQRRSKNKRPDVRGPFDRVRTAVCYDPEKGLTHQSFKDECDINRIVESYARTGIIPTGRRMEPIYGEAPDSTLFEAACAQAAIRSAEEDGFEYPSETASEAPEAPISENEGEPQGSPETPADAESRGESQ